MHLDFLAKQQQTRLDLEDRISNAVDKDDDVASTLLFNQKVLIMVSHGQYVLFYLVQGTDQSSAIELPVTAFLPKLTNLPSDIDFTSATDTNNSQTDCYITEFITELYSNATVGHSSGQHEDSRTEAYEAGNSLTKPPNTEFLTVPFNIDSRTAPLTAD